MAELDKTISFRMAPENDYYQGQVMRVVTRQLGNVRAVLSETTTGMSFDEFAEKHPTEPVDGRSAQSTADLVQGLTDEELERYGLVRQEGVERVVTPEKEEEVLEPTFNYPVHVGFGNWKLSDQRIVSKAEGGKEKALEIQEGLDSGEVDPIPLAPVEEQETFENLIESIEDPHVSHEEAD